MPKEILSLIKDNAMKEGRGGRRTGTVYIVGSGPSTIDLLTLKAASLLSEANVVLFDRLIDKKILSLCPENAELIDVGKIPGENQDEKQNRIHELMVKYAKKGKIVVRLKGGDPFLFGRGGEEAEKLSEEGIPFEVVPGVTSAIAVPAFAGIPLTHRKVSSSLAIVTGHEDPKKEAKQVDLAKISEAVDTLVILMGVGKLEENIKTVLKKRPGDTPVALIESGCTKKQRTTTSTLKNIVDDAKKAKVKPPAVLVIGDVVKLREVLKWYE